MIVFKFIMCFVGVLALTLFISALAANTCLHEKKEFEENARFRLILGLVMALCFSVVLIL